MVPSGMQSTAGEGNHGVRSPRGHAEAGGGARLHLLRTGGSCLELATEGLAAVRVISIFPPLFDMSHICFLSSTPVLPHLPMKSSTHILWALEIIFKLVFLPSALDTSQSNRSKMRV